MTSIINIPEYRIISIFADFLSVVIFYTNISELNMIVTGKLIKNKTISALSYASK